ncbi:hypothetical protein PC120_g4463 [Phytophthora cactorum]|nr:hypothetical protein PC120_g4463 [Phytophthora cactorum]
MLCLISLGCQSGDGLTGDSQVVRKPGNFRLHLSQIPRGLIRWSGVLISGGRATTSRSACGSAVDRSNISVGDDLFLGETQLLLQPLQTLLGDRVRGSSISQLSLLILDPSVKPVDLRSSKAHLLKEVIVALSKVVPLERDVIEPRLQIVDLPGLICQLAAQISITGVCGVLPTLDLHGLVVELLPKNANLVRWLDTGRITQISSSFAVLGPHSLACRGRVLQLSIQGIKPSAESAHGCTGIFRGGRRSRLARQWRGNRSAPITHTSGLGWSH